jgi:hypothetical protein
MARQPRPIRVEGDVAYVPLTKGYEAVIDAADVPLVAGFCWCAKKDRSTTYAVRNVWDGGKKRHLSMHRAIMGAAPDVLVDHRDGNGLNNRRSTNLRLATQSQNQWNKRPVKEYAPKGVTWCKCKQKWRAHIAVHGKLRSLGRFSTKEAAADAYAKASAALHGQFGRVA